MLKVSNIEVRVFIKTADSRVLNASCKNSGQNFTFLKIYLRYRISKDKWPREYLQNLGLNDSANNLSQIFMVQISILLVSRQFFIFSDWNIKFSNSEPVTGKKTVIKRGEHPNRSCSRSLAIQGLVIVPKDLRPLIWALATYFRIELGTEFVSS